MRILLGISLVSLCCLLGAVEPPSAAPQKKADELESKLDNSRFGFFVGGGVNYQTFPSSVETDKAKLFIYDVYAKNKHLGDLNFSGFGLETRAGLMKTFAILGIRAYGIYGKGWTSVRTTNKLLLSDPKDEFKFDNNDGEDLELDRTYYGGVIDLMLGNFALTQKSFYVFAGVGYVVNNYSLDGKMSFGDPDEKKPFSSFYFDQYNYYITEVHSKATTGNVLLNAGLGAFLFRHFMIEGNVALMLAPSFISSSNLKYKNSSIGPFDPPLQYANGTPVTIKNYLIYNMTFNLNLILVF